MLDSTVSSKGFSASNLPAGASMRAQLNRPPPALTHERNSRAPFCGWEYCPSKTTRLFSLEIRAFLI